MPCSRTFNPWIEGDVRALLIHLPLPHLFLLIQGFEPVSFWFSAQLSNRKAST